MLVIVSGPSGVGKDTVIAALRELPASTPRHFVVTCTTRPRRPYEVDGEHYHFLDQAGFEALRGTQARDPRLRVAPDEAVGERQQG
jgi:guanylate kinase